MNKTQIRTMLCELLEEIDYDLFKEYFPANDVDCEQVDNLIAIVEKHQGAER